jgi:hypothetical protein
MQVFVSGQVFSGLKFPPSPYSTGLLEKIIIQIKLVGMSSLLSFIVQNFVRLSAVVLELLP